MITSRFTDNVLILGFFDGIHAGHRKVISLAVDFAAKKKAKTVVLTFPASPAEYFNSNFEYIYSRETDYKILNDLGVSEIVETDFSKLANLSAVEYLDMITNKYNPIAIFSGFNYTFGKGKEGNSEFLKKYSESLGYEYYCIEPECRDNTIISSTFIKLLIKQGNIKKANEFLCNVFSFSAKVIEGAHIGRTLGFPTANMHYPKEIVKLPYGVYKVKVMDRTAIANWGIKPTTERNEPTLEIHIPNYNEDLYGKTLNVEFIDKIRDEQKFDSIEDLKIQIERDVEKCLR